MRLREIKGVLARKPRKTLIVSTGEGFVTIPIPEGWHADLQIRKGQEVTINVLEHVGETLTGNVEIRMGSLVSIDYTVKPKRPRGRPRKESV